VKQRETQSWAQWLSRRLGRILLLVWIGGVLQGGCSATNVIPISQLNAFPANFDGKEVMLRGVAKEVTRLPLFNFKSYVLQDDSGQVTILTERQLPKMNEEIRVKVKVGNLAIINGEPLGTTFVEVERH
jgi:hypothetical protein